MEIEDKVANKDTLGNPFLSGGFEVRVDLRRGGLSNVGSGVSGSVSELAPSVMVIPRHVYTFLGLNLCISEVSGKVCKREYDESDKEL